MYLFIDVEDTGLKNLYVTVDSYPSSLGRPETGGGAPNKKTTTRWKNVDPRHFSLKRFPLVYHRQAGNSMRQGESAGVARIGKGGWGADRHLLFGHAPREQTFVTATVRSGVGAGACGRVSADIFTYIMHGHDVQTNARIRRGCRTLISVTRLTKGRGRGIRTWKGWSCIQYTV